MRIEQIQAGPYVSYSVEANMLKVGDITVDLTVMQADSQVILDFTRNGNSLVEGIGGKDGYVANIILPPKEYEEVDTGRTDDNDNPVIERRGLPLNMGKVVMNLWQFKPVETKAETTIEGGMA